MMSYKIFAVAAVCSFGLSEAVLSALAARCRITRHAASGLRSAMAALSRSDAGSGSAMVPAGSTHAARAHGTCSTPDLQSSIEEATLLATQKAILAQQKFACNDFLQKFGATQTFQQVYDLKFQEHFGDFVDLAPREQFFSDHGLFIGLMEIVTHEPETVLPKLTRDSGAQNSMLKILEIGLAIIDEEYSRVGPFGIRGLQSQAEYMVERFTLKLLDRLYGDGNVSTILTGKALAPGEIDRRRVKTFIDTQCR